MTLLLGALDPETGEAMTEAEVRSNILTFIAAGHETTANTITWSLFLLSQSPQWRARVEAEAEREMGGPSEGLADRLVTTRAVIDEAIELIETLALGEEALKPVRELPYGRQRLVEIAMAFAQKPKLLLLDEPAAGVPSSESHLILDVIGRLDPDIAVLIIEHDMDVVFRFAQRITVLVSGAILTEGAPAEIAADARVREVYLGQVVHG